MNIHQAMGNDSIFASLRLWRMDLDIGELRILAGANPGSVCVLLAADQWGSPPFDWDEYLRTGV
jgi:hypothetical protein